MIHLSSLPGLWAAFRAAWTDALATKLNTNCDTTVSSRASSSTLTSYYGTLNGKLDTINGEVGSVLADTASLDALGPLQPPTDASYYNTAPLSGYQISMVRSAVERHLAGVAERSTYSHSNDSSAGTWVTALNETGVQGIVNLVLLAVYTGVDNGRCGLRVTIDGNVVVYSIEPVSPTGHGGNRVIPGIGYLLKEGAAIDSTSNPLGPVFEPIPFKSSLKVEYYRRVESSTCSFNIDVYVRRYLT